MKTSEPAKAVTFSLIMLLVAVAFLQAPEAVADDAMSPQIHTNRSTYLVTEVINISILHLNTSNMTHYSL